MTKCGIKHDNIMEGKRMLIQFTDVGRNKKSWVAMIPMDDGLLSASAMIRSIKKHKALNSSEIDIEDDGGIYVGGFRCVGRWSVVPDAEPTLSVGSRDDNEHK